MKKKEEKSGSMITDWIRDNTTPEEQAEAKKHIETHIKWLDDNPNYIKWQGTKDSYLLKDVIEAHFKPIGICVMVCEETFIFETKEEAERAWEHFKPEGWWYGIEDWPDTVKWYIKNVIGDKTLGPKVEWLTDEYKNKYDRNKQNKQNN